VKREIFDSVLQTVDLDVDDTEEVEIIGADPVLHTRFRIGEACAAVLAACGVAISDLWELRTGRRQHTRIDVGGAAAALLSFIYLRSEATPELARASLAMTALYQAAAGRWVHLHGGFPHLRDGLLELLECANEPESIAHAVSKWDAQQLEDTIAERSLCGARVRTQSEWANHPQGLALAERPLVEIRRIGESAPESLPAGDRPLSGVRVLDLTRVLAGPTCGRTLAEHGADVMRVHAPHLASIEPFVMDTGHGKLSTHLDLRQADDADRMCDLIRSGDVFSRGYRKGALEKLGFGLEELLALRPGLIVVSINCYGHEGPWSERAGWEQLAQTVTGIAAENGGIETPRLLPAAATDYTTGYLAALGTLVALARRAREGGSYEVRVSLARSGMWLQGLDRVDGEPVGLGEDQLDHYMQETMTTKGRIRHLGPVLELSETPPRWARATAELGSHPPQWPVRQA
jgi:crotonobetainyl-CoA:carnitine CoA-transferase CaiB-like acyl-CoA transferase